MRSLYSSNIWLNRTQNMNPISIWRCWEIFVQSFDILPPSLLWLLCVSCSLLTLPCRLVTNLCGEFTIGTLTTPSTMAIMQAITLLHLMSGRNLTTSNTAKNICIKQLLLYILHMTIHNPNNMVLHLLPMCPHIHLLHMDLHLHLILMDPHF